MDSYGDGHAPVVWADRSADDGKYPEPAIVSAAVLVTDASRDIAFLGEDGDLTRDPTRHTAS